MVGHLSNTSNARIGSEGTHLSFMLLQEHWFRELYLGLKVTASFDRSEYQAMESGVFVRTPDDSYCKINSHAGYSAIGGPLGALLINSSAATLSRKDIRTSSGSHLADWCVS